MDYVVVATMRLLSLVLLTAMLVPGESGWQREWRPNYATDDPEYLATTEVYVAENGNVDSFRLLRVEGDRVFIGAKSRLLYLTFGAPKLGVSELSWPADHMSTWSCLRRGMKDCDNFVRVVVQKEQENVYYICGTYAYQARCQTYTLDSNGDFKLITEFDLGVGICPLSPKLNYTAIYVEGRMYTATVAGQGGGDPLILQKVNDSTLIRTQLKNSLILNEPNFVRSDEKNDKVFFFFRETAVENINCGKAIFSRVAQVCKDDAGASKNQNFFTSFFKARLNCSIPGDYPFYFDEIQAATEFGQGNHRPTSDSGDRADMVYGVFNSPENGISGSAVCAFRYNQIEETFRGRFKGQESYLHNWLPVSWDATPKPHPAMCASVPSDNKETPHTSLNFVKTHPLMDEAVPAAGGGPMLVFTSFKSKFTQIAVDWQVLAADGKYYDVMFVGTDNGRIIKAINKGNKKVESVVIEDIQVLAVDDQVVDLKVMSPRTGQDSHLLVVSKGKVVSIPLHRCDRATTCSACVALQDPYCVWNNQLKCINAQTGLQSISTGKHASCADDTIAQPSFTLPPEMKVSPECLCPNVSAKEEPYGRRDDERENLGASRGKDNGIEDIRDIERLVSASATPQAAGLAIEIVIVAVIVSIIGSLILGFFIGFTFQACRYARERDNVFSDRNYSSLQRGRNRLSSGDNPYFHTDHSNLSPKQMNYLVNPGKVNSMETKPMTKPNKVYV